MPSTLREASDALGVARWRVGARRVLPTALGGIVTGAILAIARAAGETAPLLVADSTFGPHLTVNLFGRGAEHPGLDPDLIRGAEPGRLHRAWGAALVLLAVILIANIGARLLLARSRRKITG